ncbi:MAG: hypothetical protein A2901_07670 [Elusimicrobia bacterium RIFCSPLOWO2_01_FULL_54_10]|nr:MAG: hypothetical protein A2901_07670 [Elusimicrobia bacterium RIFCSPLOWO2_01_FULL_54_10]
MKKYKILIVDDERPLAEMIRINFPANQFDATACFTGKDALAQTDADRPDLILLDVMMGDMSGWEVLLRLKSNPKTATVPVIMCTAKDGPEDIEMSFQHGAQSYIIKPINFPKLMHKISAILDMERLLKET